MMPSELEFVKTFFAKTDQEIEPPNSFGVLYLLRRDIITCIGRNPSTGRKIKYKALFPGAISILVGIDLLAKFFIGSDDSQKSSKRFKKFLEQYFDQLTERERVVIYQLRNALIHSFGLYSETRQGEIFRFTLVINKKDKLVRKIHKGKYKININALALAFDSAISKYYDALINDIDLLGNFIEMYKKYGSIKIY